jgi:hypothetical protein
MLLYVLQTIYQLSYSYLVKKYLLLLPLDILYDEVNHPAHVSHSAVSFVYINAVVILLNT